MSRRVRDFQEVVQRVECLPRRIWWRRVAAHIGPYPFLVLERQFHREAPCVFLTGGMHGEEPGGVEGVLRWLESGAATDWPVNWLVLPCINPYGWERNQRRNRQRLDINRQFRNSTGCVEANVVKRIVAGRRFLVSVEFHEDVDATGYYLYEGLHGELRVGRQVLRAVAKWIPINRDRRIDGNQATVPGLIERDPSPEELTRRRQWPMAYHLFHNCTNHVLGSETPVHHPLVKRAEAHCLALRQALRLIV